MIGQFLLGFREALEAALIVAMILAYLKRTGRGLLSRYVWYGVFLAVVSSLFLGGLIWTVYGDLPESIQGLFEGVAALFAVLVLSSMIYWMGTKGRELRVEVERRVEDIVTRGATLGLISFSFIIVFREGLETVLFLAPFLFSDLAGTLTGAILGIAASSALAYAIYAIGMRINIRRFFYFTSILLVFLAGGLAGYGVHELADYAEETGIKLGWLGKYAYSLNIPEGNPFHDKGIVGSILAAMFGYAVRAEWVRVIVHIAYLLVMLPLVILIYRRQTDRDRTESSTPR